MKKPRIYLDYWLNLLRLQDWDVEIKWVAPDKLEYHGFGEITWTLDKKKANVLLCSPEAVSAERNHDPEKTLVHELLHLHFSTVCRTKDGTYEDKAHEASIDQVARALIKLRRGGAR